MLTEMNKKRIQHNFIDRFSKEAVAVTDRKRQASSQSISHPDIQINTRYEIDDT